MGSLYLIHDHLSRTFLENFQSVQAGKWSILACRMWKSQEKNKEIIQIHYDTEKSMPKEKRKRQNFFLDMLV